MFLRKIGHVVFLWAIFTRRKFASKNQKNFSRNICESHRPSEKMSLKIKLHISLVSSAIIKYVIFSLYVHEQKIPRFNQCPVIKKRTRQSVKGNFVEAELPVATKMAKNSARKKSLAQKSAVADKQTRMELQRPELLQKLEHNSKEADSQYYRKESVELQDLPS